ncbi:HMG-Y-related protein A [Ananas comosus]|uniref:HMG-Y-related protein A n=1 Tax=Ananas comosus TaxID=4615 RepID=A0A199UN92_ANACO|nr:HMG-Y-related protein A [Ananas comosus]
MAAIAALNETNGSNKSAIAKYIESKYGGELPESHASLLTAHLARMKESGDLLFLKNNYLRPGVDTPPKRGRGRPPKPKVPGSAPAPAAAAAAAASPRPRGRPPSPGTPRRRRRPGRRRDAKAPRPPPQEGPRRRCLRRPRRRRRHRAGRAEGGSRVVREDWISLYRRVDLLDIIGSPFVTYVSVSMWLICFGRGGAWGKQS